MRPTPASTLTWDLAVQQDSQNPVYYVQYAHARICSILKNLASDGITPGSARGRAGTAHRAGRAGTDPLPVLLHREVTAAAKALDPAKITKYVMNLSTLFHKFYNACRVKAQTKP